MTTGGLFYFFAFALAWLIGFRLFHMWAYLRTPASSESPPAIPSEMDDWDAEFKEKTGVSPFPEVVIRSGAPVTTFRQRDYSLLPGDVSYYRHPHGFVVAEGEAVKFIDCEFR